MNWRAVLGLALLWAAWIVCSSEKTARPAERGSHGVRKVPLAHRAPSSLLRRSGASLRNLSPNPQHPVTRRDPSASPKAPANLVHEETHSQGRSTGTRTRRVQRLMAAAKYSKSAMIKDEGISTASQSRAGRFPSGSSSSNILASFAGKNRVWVISAPHASEGYYRLMMSLLKNDVYCELAERHIQQIVLFHEAGEEGGKVRRITNEGKILEQPLDPALIPKLMSFLKLEKGKFGMVLLKKTLQVEERYPYPVRLEAMYEVIDQSPIRKIEKIRQKGFIQACKAAGVEGQVVEEGNNGGSTRPTPGGGEVQGPARKEEPRRSHNQPSRTKTVRKSMTTTVAPPPPTIRTTTLPPTTTTTRATTRAATTASQPTTTTALPITQRTWTTKSHSATEYHRLPVTATEDFYSPVWNANRKERQRGHPEKNQVATRRPSKASRYESFTEAPTAPAVHYTKASTGRFKDNRTDRKDYSHRDPNITPGQHKPTKSKAPKKKGQEKILNNEYEEKYDPSKPTSPHLEEEIAVGNIPPKKGRESKKHDRMDKPEKKKKKERVDKLQKSEKQSKKDKAEKKSKQDKDRNKKSKKGSRTENEDFPKPNKKPFLHPPRKSVTDLLEYFEGKRRLILITTPKTDNTMYVQQRDEYLESFCKMATRKISVITIFGTMNNCSMKIDHFQLDNEKPMKVIEDEDLVDQQLISELRKEYGMTYNDFFMVLTDIDMKVKQYYEVPIAMKSVFDLIDTFQSRIKDMERQKKEGIVCKEDKKQSLESFLSRFRWRRRLVVISAPSDEDWAYSQQLAALSGQACNFGLRHITILKLLGLGEDIGGVLELYPINGSSTVDREDIPANLVKDIRNYFQISPEYFSMLLVGKDGNVKSWYPSPMWSMAIVYDLIDSMQLRRQEMTIQQSLGMQCPDDEYGGYGYHSYHQGYQEGYQDDYRHHGSYHHGYPY
ncbi:Coiled-coil domain-containing protein 80 [Tinamus guttatus]|uniref:Coiled-coil domain-containing protein 80 n=1 Tax=Tinamus guttatus TaxID=94827 RepID=A0A099Z4K6_TINGU|nr:PREDICTED: coiled-coil domain-containing protein 80 [Tinamus guttatus]XP_010210698.1 PREDICTED: coiled-coil domain-containing protein 80 [Tinamus guttatus]KGL75745.1 Coiled-coil domain-containing protein 80 [Tinamus guttatus]